MVMWEMTGRRDTGKAKTSKTRQNLYLFNRFTEEKVSSNLLTFFICFN